MTDDDLSITLADDALDDDCTCSVQCAHDAADDYPDGVTHDSECPLHGSFSGTSYSTILARVVATSVLARQCVRTPSETGLVRRSRSRIDGTYRWLLIHGGTAPYAHHTRLFEQLCEGSSSGTSMRSPLPRRPDEMPSFDVPLGVADSRTR